MSKAIHVMYGFACSLKWVGVLSIIGWSILILISVVVAYLFILQVWRIARRQNEIAAKVVRVDALCAMLGWCALLIGILLTWCGLNATWTDFSDMGSAIQPTRLLCYRDSILPGLLGLVCCLLARIQNAAMCCRNITVGEKGQPCV